MGPNSEPEKQKGEFVTGISVLVQMFMLKKRVRPQMSHLKLSNVNTGFSKSMFSMLFANVYCLFATAILDVKEAVIV